MKEIAAIDIHRTPDNLEVFLFNVGQGDHILLRFPSGEYGIIDFHYAANPDVVEPPSLSYFKALKETLPPDEFSKITISFFCISHTDKDHVKGVVEAIQWFDTYGVFIRDIWLGAARDEAQLINFLKERIPSVLENSGLSEKLKLAKPAELFQNYIAAFFTHFSKWKDKNFNSPRYANEPMGTGEYLAEIRALPYPARDTDALNVGPLLTQLDDYFNQLNLDLLRKILGVEIDESCVDKNLMSHILRIRFGQTNLLFGGDTHRDIWEKCLNKYYSPLSPYPKLHGELDAHFIKVSHHGSKNSSSKEIWNRCIPKDKKVYMGISAGQHHSYHHPNTETITEIRSVRKDANILVTNFCMNCILQNSLDKELHTWYDDYLLSNSRYKKAVSTQEDRKIDNITRKISRKRVESKTPGLFAYIFTVPADPLEGITVRFALSKVNGRATPCFYKDRTDKTFDECKQSPKV